jgi:hypothetical protein
MSARDIIIDLRGGVPEKCDFCKQPTPPENLHPEEAGDWACITCINHWRKEGEQY